MIKWIKYLLVLVKSAIMQETVVEMFGNTYIVYGRVVKCIRK